MIFNYYRAHKLKTILGTQAQKLLGISRTMHNKNNANNKQTNNMSMVRKHNNFHHKTI